MKIFILAVILLCFGELCTAVIENDWPFYVKRCARNNPQLGNCMQNVANEALGPILRGDSSIGLTNLLSNLHTNLIEQNINFGTNQTWKVQLVNTNYYGLQHIYVEGMNWDFDNRNVNINLKFESSITVNGAYTSSGTVGDRDITGRGNADIILVGGVYGSNITYTLNYNLINIAGADYVQVRNASCAITSPVRFEFTNLDVSLEDALQILDGLNSSPAFGNEVLPQINNVCASMVTGRMNPFFLNFPLDMIFV